MEYRTPESVPPELQVGDVILNRYEVREKFDGGGMGLVYRVYHREWQTDLAVKSPRPELFETEANMANFESEAETWVDVGLHPHVVTCYYIRRLGGIPSMFAEFMEAGTLAAWMADGRLYKGTEQERLARVLDVSIQIAWGLSHAHYKGLIHQDVKPENILMMHDGTAKITDFGLSNARRFTSRKIELNQIAGQSVWNEGAGFFTPRYASPEQISGNKLTQASDIWSWALVVLAMMKGECIWQDGRAGHAVLCEHYGPIIDHDPVARLLNRCLQTDAKLRTSNITDVSLELIGIYNSFAGHSYPRPNPATQSLEADGLSNRGASYAHLDKFAEADICFNQALFLDPRNVHATFNKFATQYRNGRCTDIDVIKQLLTIRDTSNNRVIGQALNEFARERGLEEQPEEYPEYHLNVAGVKMPIEGQFVGLEILSGSSRISAIAITNGGLATIADCQTQQTHSIKLALPNDFNNTAVYFEKSLATSDGKHIVSLISKFTQLSGKNSHPSYYICVHSLNDGEFEAVCATPNNRSLVFNFISHDCLLTSDRNDSDFCLWSIPKLTLIGKIDLSKAGSTEDEENTSSPHPTPDKLSSANAHHAARIPKSDFIGMQHRAQISLWRRIGHQPRILEPHRAHNSGSNHQLQFECFRVLKTKRTSLGTCLAVSSCGCLVAAGSPLSIWNQDGDLETILPYSDFAQPDVCLAFSPDKRYLAAAGRGLIRIWDLVRNSVACTITNWLGESALFWSVEKLTVCSISSSSMGVESGLSIWSWKPPLPSSYLLIARPTSFCERAIESESFTNSTNQILLHIKCGRLAEALTELRLLQQQEPGRPESQTDEIERQLDLLGNKTLPTGLHLEAQILCEKTSTKSINLEGGQILLIANEIKYSAI